MPVQSLAGSGTVRTVTTPLGSRSRVSNPHITETQAFHSPMAYARQSAQHAALGAAEAAGREAVASAAAAAVAAATRHRRTPVLASTEALAGLIGAIICLAFVLSPKGNRVARLAWPCNCPLRYPARPRAAQSQHHRQPAGGLPPDTPHASAWRVGLPLAAPACRPRRHRWRSSLAWPSPPPPARYCWRWRRGSTRATAPLSSPW